MIPSDSLFSFSKKIFLKNICFVENFNISENNITSVELAQVACRSGNTQICGLCDPALTSARPIEQMKTPYLLWLRYQFKPQPSYQGLTLVTYPVHPPTSTLDYLDKWMSIVGK